MHIPMDTFHMEMRKVPPHWAQAMSRKREGFNARRQYARRRVMYQSVAQVN